MHRHRFWYPLPFRSHLLLTFISIYYLISLSDLLPYHQFPWNRKHFRAGRVELTGKKWWLHLVQVGFGAAMRSILAFWQICVECLDVAGHFSYVILLNSDSNSVKQEIFVSFYDFEAEIWLCERGCPGLYHLSVSVSAGDHSQLSFLYLGLHNCHWRHWNVWDTISRKENYHNFHQSYACFSPDWDINDK